jgi:hypothetical protein
VQGFIQRFLSYSRQPIALYAGLFYDNPALTVLCILEKMKNELLRKDGFYNLKMDILVQEIIIENERLSNSVNQIDNQTDYAKKSEK